MEDNWSPGYEYTPFAPVRLLHVARDPYDSSICGTLRNFSLDSKDCPKFTTISYVWGQQVYTRSIQIDGQNFPVLDSVYSILETLCDAPAFRDAEWIWIDSICINLRDPHERASQVLLMKQIYSKSRRTVAWLGEESAELAEGMAFLSHLSWRHSEIKAYSRERNTREVPQHLRLPEKWKALESFFNLDWWKRMWTLQEYVSCNWIDLYCGSQHVNEGTLQAALSSIWYCEPDSELIRPDLWAAAWTRDRLREWYKDKTYSLNMNLVALMAYTGACELTDPRDRIYGLLGLAKERDRVTVGRPAYADDVGDIYLRLITSLINEYRSLDMICFAQIFRSTDDKEDGEMKDEGLKSQWPSWVPDWRVQVVPFVAPLMVSQTSGRHIGNFRPPGYGYFLELQEAQSYRADGGMSSPNIIDTDSTRLKCQGFSIDSIDGLGSVLSSPDHSATQRATPFIQSTSDVNTLDEALEPKDSSVFMTDIARTLTLDRLDRYFSTSAPGEQFRDEFLNLINVAQLVDRESLPARGRSVCAWYDANKDLLLRGRTLDEHCHHWIPTRDISVEDIRTHPKTFASRLVDCTSPITMQKKLLVTAGGLIGMAPPQARKGDLVCVLLGCSVPVVLREVHVGQQSMYRFIGECYLHGFMNGEVGHQGKDMQGFTII
ncbi:heterokaryon incompatibility protein-domain-containing protein [Pestalotiopsis sp. NC0098]|nr:heterokaryon incompatibility protein-domain-containing protein [Pestalotiopsis sp. NC0098]